MIKEAHRHLPALLLHKLNQTSHRLRSKKLVKFDPTNSDFCILHAQHVYKSQRCGELTAVCCVLCTMQYSHLTIARLPSFHLAAHMNLS